MNKTLLQVVSATADLVALSDIRSDRLLYLNPAGRKLLGVGAEEDISAWRLADFQVAEPGKAPPSEQLRRQPKGGAWSGESVFCGRDGRRTTLSLEVLQLEAQEGQEACFSTIGRDITQLAAALETAREEAKRYHTLVEYQGEGVVILDSNQHFTFANAAAGEILGCSPDKLQGRRFQEFLAEKDLPMLRHQIELRKGGHKSTYELELIRGAGQRRQILITATPQMDRLGKFGGSFVVFRDITKRKQADEQLRLQTSALEATSNGIIIADRTGRILWVNPAFSHLSGFSGSEAIGQNTRLLKSGRQAPGFYAEMWRVILSGKVWHGEVVNRRKDGSEYYEEMTITPVMSPEGEIAHFVAVKQDISQRKQFEEALSRERDLLQALMDNLPDYLYFKDSNSRFTRINAAQARLLGVANPADALGKTDLDFLPLNYARQAQADERRLFATGEPIVDRIEELRTGPEKVAWISSTKAPIRDASGQITGLVGASRDITERRRADERLAKINQCFLGFGEDIQENIRQMTQLARELLNAEWAIYCRVPVGPLIASAQRRRAEQVAVMPGLPVRFLSEALERSERRLFVTNELASGAYATDLAECNLRSISTWVGLPVLLDQKVIGCLNLLFETDFTLTSASERVLGIIAAAIRVEEDRWNAQLERNHIEVQLRQAQKLEAIGQLAAGIAHEINTPAQYVGDNTRFLQDTFKSLQQVLQAQEELLQAVKNNSATSELVTRIEAAAAAADLEYLFAQIPAAITESLEGVDRITKIVRAMKEFSHPGGKEKAIADLNKAIESTVTVARNEWKYVADVHLELDPTLPVVPCFLGEFNQAILNLVINAAHAIGEVVKKNPGTKGAITIRTRRKADQVEIQVEDTGTGIPEAIRPRIFEPFFTTKEVGKGTGQGLTMVYSSIVKKHGGAVTFESEVGKGTTFFVRLPLAPGLKGDP